MSIDTAQRFSKNHPCPVCEGFDAEPRGTSRRCFGFMSSDGKYAYCTRAEHAGSLVQNADSGTYAHKLVGSCKCGREHAPPDPQSGTARRPKKRVVATYDYGDEQGALLYQVVRYEPKTFKVRRPNGNDGWVWDLKNVRRVPYRLPDLMMADRGEWVFVVEGEKDADRLAGLGLIATTNLFGAGKWTKAYSKFLRQRRVVILRDNDTEGYSHAKKIAGDLFRKATVLKLPVLPGLEPKGDVSDWLDSGGTATDLRQIAEDAPEWNPDPGSTEPDQNDNTLAVACESQAVRLIEFIEELNVELFHDPIGDSWARVEVHEHREIWSCQSRRFRQWLAGLVWDKEQNAPSSEALSSALNVIQAKARFDGPEHELHNRVARHDGAIWYDLGDADWRAVRVDAHGWCVVESPPILFRRYAHQCPQVGPQRGGELRKLLSFVNVTDDDHRLLLLVYLVSCFIPDIPHPIPVLHGGQGAAKTTLVRMLRRIIDPSQTETLGPAKDPTEMVQQLSHHWAPYYDNITHLPQWMSDVLCRASTGGGFSKRKLYTDEEDIILSFRRCPALNGINIAAQQPDLLDRCLLFGLEPIPEHQRRDEEKLWEEFEAVRPLLVGAALDALSGAMKVKPDVRLERLPRMADFAIWGTAIALALGYSEQDFVNAIERNFSDRNEEILNSDVVAGAVRLLMESRCAWEGTPTQLLGDLDEVAARLKVNVRSKEWPKAPNTLTKRLNVLTGNLWTVGINVSHSRATGGRTISIRRQDPKVEANDGRDGNDDVSSREPSLRKGCRFQQNDGSDGNDDVSRTLGGIGETSHRHPGQSEKKIDGSKAPGKTVTTVTTVIGSEFPLFSHDDKHDGSASGSTVSSRTNSSPCTSDVDDRKTTEVDPCRECSSAKWWKSSHGDILCQNCGTILVRVEDDPPGGGAA